MIRKVKREHLASAHFIQMTEGNTLRPLDDVLQEVFSHAVEFCAGNKSAAADGLGISRTTFYRKMGAHRELLSQVYRESRAKKHKT